MPTIKLSDISTGALYSELYTSPTFTGTPTAPTATTGTSNTQLATTAFVVSEINNQPELVVVTNTALTAVTNKHYVLTNTSLTTVTLPASPTAGDKVWVTVANGLTTNIVDRNGKPIQSTSENLTIDAAYASIQFRFINNTVGWTFV